MILILRNRTRTTQIERILADISPPDYKNPCNPHSIILNLNKLFKIKDIQLEISMALCIREQPIDLLLCRRRSFP